MKLENIQTLQELNQILNATAKYGNEYAVIVSSGTRDFKLCLGDEAMKVKMKDIISTFERLAKTDPDKHLIGEIHDRIFELNKEGERKLWNLGAGAVFLRGLKTLFLNFHDANIDSIQSKYLFSPKIKVRAEEIVNGFKECSQHENSEYRKKNQVGSLIARMYEDSTLHEAEYHPDKNSRLESKKGEEDTKNAIRYIAYHNPKIGGEILNFLHNISTKTLKNKLYKDTQQEDFCKSLILFAKVLQEERNLPSEVKKNKPKET